MSMGNIWTLSLLLLLRLLSRGAVHGQNCEQPNCGYLDEEQHANFTHITGINEFAWIGRLGYESARGINYKCLAVLISEQHLLAPAHCFNEAMLEDQPLRHVLLGDWNPTNPFMQQDCSAQTNCAAIPQLFSIAEVIIHPDYQASTLLNNIALLKLTHALDFSESIRAICLPPYRGSSTSYAHFAQFLSYAGFAVEKSLPFKLKGLMHVAGTSACKRKLRNLNYITASRDSPLNHICANSNLDAQIFTGAPLMDVQVRDSEPSNYYLVGLLVGPDRYTGSETVNLFMRIQPHREWIEYNMLCNSTAATATSSTTTTTTPRITSTATTPRTTTTPSVEARLTQYNRLVFH